MAERRKAPSPSRTGYLSRLTLKNVRCFREVSIDLDPHVTVLIGDNGSGKTTVIEALASLTHGEGEGLSDFPLARGARSGTIAAYEQSGGKWGVKRIARWSSGGESERRRLAKTRWLFAYGRYRRVFFPTYRSAASGSLPEKGLRELAERASLGRTATLVHPDNHLLRDLSRYLVLMDQGRRSELNLEESWRRLEDLLRGLGQGITGIEMERGVNDYVPRIVRNGVHLELRELSDGYQSLLVILFDLVLRYAYLFSGLRNPLEGEALVAIDEVDLHLHPRWQRMVTRQLTSLFPKTQFVLTTHSPAVVQGAIDDGRLILALTQAEGGVEVQALKPRERKGLRGAEIGSILQEEKLFGVESRYSAEYAEIESRVAELSRKAAKAGLTDEERAQVFADMETLQRLVADDEKRRADGSFLSQITGLRIGLLRDLAEEIQREKS